MPLKLGVPEVGTNVGSPPVAEERSGYLSDRGSNSDIRFDGVRPAAPRAALGTPELRS